MWSLFFISLIFLGLGGIISVFPRQAERIFNRSGRWIWRISTLGLTDMRWLYKDTESYWKLRILGGAMLLGSVFTLTMFFMSLSGPGMLYAMRKAGDYLEKKYDHPARDFSMHASATSGDTRSVKIAYKGAAGSGTLMAHWDGDRYHFVEEKETKTSPASR